MELIDEIKKLEETMIAQRRLLHQNPELSYQEFHTTEFLKKELLNSGIELEPLQMPTGVSAIIRGERPGKTICIRHDIDALPIQEATGLSFASEMDGISHACGHDIHAIIALYCAKLLQERKDSLAGNVRIVFQPAEEPCDGAQAMIKAGLMDLTPPNDIVVGLHTHPDTPAGSICLRKGPMEAGVEHLKITIRGKGGHGAHPYRCVDPIMTAAFLLTQLQAIITRENQAVKPTVLTFGSIHGGQASNAIPDQVTILGTLRTFYPECREQNIEAIRHITHSVCEGMRAEGEVEIMGSLPPLYNDGEVVDDIIHAAHTVLGEDKVVEFEFPSPGSDDFSVFLEYSKGAQFFLGTANDNPGSRLGLHNASNIFDETCIAAGVAVLTQYVLDRLCEGGNKS